MFFYVTQPTLSDWNFSTFKMYLDHCNYYETAELTDVDFFSSTHYTKTGIKLEFQ